MKSINDFQTEEQWQAYLRTYFAAMAMQGMLSNPSMYDTIGGNVGANLAKDAIIVADELLKQLS